MVWHHNHNMDIALQHMNQNFVLKIGIKGQKPSIPQIPDFGYVRHWGVLIGDGYLKCDILWFLNVNRPYIYILAF